MIVPTDIIAPMMIYVRTMPLIDFFDYRCYRIWYVDYFCEREFLPIDSTALILAGAQSFSWMIPVVLSILGIGLFVVSRKSE